MTLPEGRAKESRSGDDVRLTLELDPAMPVHETMESLGALWQLIQVALQHLGEGVEH